MTLRNGVLHCFPAGTVLAGDSPDSNRRASNDKRAEAN